MKTFFSTLTLGLAGQALGRAVVDIESRSHTDNVAHGNYANFNGVVQRWHEVSDDLFMAVNPKRWDDNVHVRRSLSPEKRALANKPPGFSPVPSTTALEDRDLESVCAVVLDCAETAGDTLQKAGADLLNLGERFISKIVVDLGPQFLELLQDAEVYKPALAGFIGIGGSAFIVQLSIKLLEPSLPGGSPKDAQPLQVCDESMSHEDITKALNLKACQSFPERNSYEQSVKMPDGSSWGFSISAAPGQTLGGSDVCEVVREDELSWIEE